MTDSMGAAVEHGRLEDDQRLETDRQILGDLFPQQRHIEPEYRLGQFRRMGGDPNGICDPSVELPGGLGEAHVVHWAASAAPQASILSQVQGSATTRPARPGTDASWSFSLSGRIFQ